MRKSRVSLALGLLALAGGCEHGAPSAAHVPPSAPPAAQPALSAGARATLGASIDLDAMDRLLATMNPEERARFLESFADAEWVASGRRDVETRDVSVIVRFADPERQHLLEQVWAPFWTRLPASALTDPSYPLPGRTLAAARQADSLAPQRNEREP